MWLRSSRTITAVSLVAAFLLGSATYGAVEMAGATGTNTVYYACLSSTGVLSHVGTTKPTATLCKAPSTVISWNSQGPIGPVGPKGPVGPGITTYNWSATVPAASTTTVYYPGATNLPSGSTIAIASALLTGNFSACVFGWSVAFYSSEGSGVPATWSGGTNVTNQPPTTTSPETLRAQSPLVVAGQFCISSSGTPIPLPPFSFNITFTDTPAPTVYH